MPLDCARWGHLFICKPASLDFNPDGTTVGTSPKPSCGSGNYTPGSRTLAQVRGRGGSRDGAGSANPREIIAWLWTVGPSRPNAIRKRHAASSRCEFGPSTEGKRAHDQGHSGRPMGPRKAVLFGNLAGRATASRAWPLDLLTIGEPRKRCDGGPS
jgi:hypothetical protein